MGECHALAFTAVAPLFQPRLRPRLAVVADVNAAAAERARDRFGFARATADWRELVADPAVGLVSITAPNVLHKEMALAAIAAGKHVYCEKPLALTAADARELALAAEATGVRTLVGYNYLCSPAIQHIKQLLTPASSAGSPTCAPPSRRTTWPTRPCRSPGAASAPEPAAARWATWQPRDQPRPLPGRPDRRGAGRHRDGGARARGGAAGRRPAVRPGRAAERDARGRERGHRALPVPLRQRLLGSIITSRTAWGRKNGPDLELYGTLGAVRFRQERFNEFELFRAGVSVP